jgi:hypothetical protein
VQRLTVAAAAGALSLALTAGAAAQTPAQGLAKQLKASMVTYYAKTQPRIRLTTVTCKISADQTSARCLAHFANTSRRAVGVFTVSVTEDNSGVAHTKTVGVACKDAKTGKKVSCF